MKHNLKSLKALGKQKAKFTELETFPAPENVSDVTCTSDEVTAVCPVTGQPDWYLVEIHYQPRLLCVESKSLKLFLQSFRQQGHFCENFSQIIATKLMDALVAKRVTVTVTQKPRGGIAIKSVATVYENDRMEDSEL